jgi:hypothetical protein
MSGCEAEEADRSMSGADSLAWSKKASSSSSASSSISRWAALVHPLVAPVQAALQRGAHRLGEGSGFQRLSARLRALPICEFYAYQWRVSPLLLAQTLLGPYHSA